MSKHKQSASLGNLNNYALHTPMPEPDNVYERVEKLERRVATLEGLLNDVMHQIDNPVRNQSFRKPSASNGKPQSKSKPQHPSKPKKVKAKGKGKQAFGSHFTDTQMAEIKAHKDTVKALFEDGESLTKQAAVERLDLDAKIIGRVLAVLAADGVLSMEKPKPTEETPDPKVIFTRK